MMPTMEERLTSMIVGMTKTIIPALHDADSLAREQAGLILGHLQVLRAQVDHSVRYEQLELRDTRNLAETLRANAEGGVATSIAATSLGEILDRTSDVRSPQDVRAVTEQLNAAVAALIHAASADGRAAFRQLYTQVTLRFAKARALSERAWFAGTGFEAHPGDMPSITTLMERLERNA